MGENISGYSQIVKAVFNLEEPEQLNDDQVQKVKSAITKLSKREQQAISSRFGLEGGECKSYVEIGAAMGCGYEGARQIAARALRALKHNLELEHLLYRPHM